MLAVRQIAKSKDNTKLKQMQQDDMSEKKVRERNLTIILKKEKNNQKRTNTTELWFSSLISYL